MVKRVGAEEARAILPELLERAHHGTASLITKRGKVYAAVVPLEQYKQRTRGPSLLALAGTGRGLWGRSSKASLRRLRDEWA